ncbi:hypothetical protein NKH77_00395 [Streptomyces sp. M19]
MKALYVCGPVLVYLGDLPALEERAAQCAALAAHFGEMERGYAAATELRVWVLRGDLEQVVSRVEAQLATDWREKPSPCSLWRPWSSAPTTRSPRAVSRKPSPGWTS